MANTPIPTKLKVLRGDNHPGRLNRDEPQPAKGLPEPPEGTSPAVVEVFEFTINELALMGVAARCDRDSLLCYAEAVVSHRKACRLLAQTDVLIKGRNGNLVRNPALAAQRDTSFTIRMFAQEFGLTPAARSRIYVGAQAPGALDPEAQRDNPFANAG